MAKIAKNLTELIGHTPLMELAEYSRKYGLKRNIVAKLESFNPAGSVKDRVAFAMIEDAEARGDFSFSTSKPLRGSLSRFL